MSFGLGGIIGAILGFFLQEAFFGSIIGYFIGSSFDRVNGRASGNYDQFRDRFRSYQYTEDYYTTRITQNDFATALLILSGAVMKADGKVLKSELDYVKSFFRQQFFSKLSYKVHPRFQKYTSEKFCIE